MDFGELLEKRRAIRDFEDREVTLDLIKEVINDSIKAPNANNLQPWSFIVVNNKAMMKRISNSCKNALLADIEKDPDSPMKGFIEYLSDENSNAFYNAPCLVFIVGPAKNATPIKGAAITIDCALVSCYFMFSATSRGLGTCWVALGSELRAPELLDEIGMPEGYSIYASIIVGYPKSIPPCPERKAPRILKVIL